MGSHVFCRSIQTASFNCGCDFRTKGAATLSKEAHFEAANYDSKANLSTVISGELSLCCCATSPSFMGLSVQAHHGGRDSILLEHGERRSTHSHKQAGREDPAALTPQHGSLKNHLFQAQHFCCLSSAANRSTKRARAQLIPCPGRRCLYSGGCLLVCVREFGEADEGDYLGELGYFPCSRL